jgi:sulfur carrier protein ThiS
MVRAGGREIAWREGMTVADVVAALGDDYPYAAARIGERIVTAPHFASTPVPDEAEIFLLPLVAGG